MPAVSYDFLSALDWAMHTNGLHPNRSPYLEEKNVHYLQFHGFGDARMPPVVFRIAEDRDDSGELFRFLGIAPITTRFGNASLVFLQGAGKAGVEEVVRIMKTVYGTRCPPGESVGIEWIGEWLVFNPEKRWRELGGDPSALRDARERNAAAHVAEPRLEAPELVAPRRLPRKRAAADHRTAHRSLAPRYEPRDSGHSGFAFEDELSVALRDAGLAFVVSDELDRWMKTDFLILSVDGDPLSRPVALQVTLQWNALLKLKDFRNKRAKRVRYGRTFARRVYVQVAEGSTPQDVAVAIKAFLATPQRQDANTTFAEVGPDGWNAFDADTRIAMLSERADPGTTSAQRLRGSIEMIRTHGVLIRGDDHRAYWAYMSELVDSRLYDLVRHSGTGDSRSAQGRPVSFIPFMAIDAKNRRRALSVLLAPAA